MDFARSFTNSNNHQQSSSSTNSSGTFPFNINLPRIDLSSLGQSLSQNNLLPPNLDSILTSAKGYSNEMPNCESCATKFTFLKRKKSCGECSMDFCMSCITKDPRNSRRIRCRRCITLKKVPLDRNELMGLRVRDLRWYLNMKRISAHLCKEKTELVDLIIQSSRDANHYFSGNNHYGANYRSTSDIPSQTQSDPYQRDDHTNNTNDFIPQESENISQNASADNVVNTETSIRHDSNGFKPFNIDDVTGPEQIQSLNVRQLKLLLTRNFVDYKGCCEREELVEKALRLWHDRQDNKRRDISDVTDDNMCKICMESTIDCVLLECGHMVTCTLCGKRLAECPICRQYVVRVVHTFKA